MNQVVRAYEHAQPRVDLDALVHRHADLVKRIAYHLARRLPPQVEIQDLTQAGMMGLLEAAQNYSSGRGASFETFAGIRIRGAMLDALRKLDWAPRSVYRKTRAAALALREIEARLGAQATEADVAAHLGVSLSEYQRVLQDALGCQLVRFNEGDAGDDSPLAGVADSAPDPERLALDESRRRAIVAAIKQLPERERLVLSLYYKHELNLKEIGAVLKVTESRVCQLRGQALLRLRAVLVDWYR